jgi:hypothetical protein
VQLRISHIKPKSESPVKYRDGKKEIKKERRDSLGNATGDTSRDAGTPFMVLTRVCLEFQKTGPSDALESMLQEQLESNPYIAPKLLDQEEVSPFSVHSFSVGDDDEADAYCQSFRSLWKATPGALPWLSSVFREFVPPEPELT